MIDDIFSTAPTKPLFHYTDQIGFIGIITNKEIWLTHNQYLNDTEEFIYAIGLLKKEIETIRASLTERKYLGIIEMMLEGLDEIHHTNVMVCSFSEEPNSLPQWRAYATKAGLAIGFSAKHLFAITEKSSIRLAKCLYTKSEQKALIKKVVSHIFEQYRIGKFTREDDSSEPLPNQVIPYMLKIAPIIKHPAFKSEKEWRYITLKPCTSENFQFRQGQSFIVPYYKQSLLNEQGELPIEKVIIGPTPFPELSKRSVQRILIKEQRNKNNKKITSTQTHELLLNPQIPVEISNVPYRNW